MRATQLLHDEIRHGEFRPGPALPGPREGNVQSLIGAVDAAVSDLHALLTRLEEARHALREREESEGQPRAG
jgi:hypothetical protein